MERSSDVRRRAQAAAEGLDWPEVYRLLASVPEAELDADELDLLADAAWAVGDMQVSERARTAGHGRYVAADDSAGAAWTALFLAGDAFMRNEFAVATGWHATGERFLAEAPECAAHARLLYGVAFQQVAAGDFDAAIGSAERCRSVASRVRSRELEMLGLHVEGRARAKRGELSTGLPMLDEAMSAALGGGLAPWASMWISCYTITTCHEVGDYRRAAEWTDACDRAMVARGLNFSADCHIHRACSLKHTGSWARAEAEARLGCSQPAYDHSFQWHAGWGWCEIGDLRLRMGNIDGAEEAFAAALARGYPPHPGIALLRLAQGHVDLAVKAIEQALGDVGADPPSRIRLLDAAVTIQLEAGKLDAAARAESELAELCTTFDSDAFRAVATKARALIALAGGSPDTAAPLLRDAVDTWLRLGMPYEAAQARVSLAEAQRAIGDLDRARLELIAAHSAMAELGAELEAKRVAASLVELDASAPAPSAGRPVERTFMFTDIERSTALAEAMGEQAWDKILRWHDRLLAEVIRAHGGRVIKHEGDGVFASFGSATDALDAAVTIQQRLEAHRSEHGFAPRVRIGLHCGSATERHGDYFGMAVNVAARVMALTDGGAITATEPTTSSYHGRLGPAKAASVEGISEPLRVVDVEWTTDRAGH